MYGSKFVHKCIENCKWIFHISSLSGHFSIRCDFILSVPAIFSSASWRKEMWKRSSIFTTQLSFYHTHTHTHIRYILSDFTRKHTDSINRADRCVCTPSVQVERAVGIVLLTKLWSWAKSWVLLFCLAFFGPCAYYDDFNALPYSATSVLSSFSMAKLMTK